MDETDSPVVIPTPAALTAGRTYSKWVAEILKGCHCLRTMRAALIAAGFFVEGNTHGVSKLCFRHERDPRFVVKVFKRKCAWYNDDSTVGIRPTIIEPYWLANIFVCRRYVIQPFANGIGGSCWDAKKFFQSTLGEAAARDSDLHHCNVAFHDGRPVIFDYNVEWKTWRPQWRRPTLRVVHKYERTRKVVGK